jgi:hypothetical protein
VAPSQTTAPVPAPKPATPPPAPKPVVPTATATATTATTTSAKVPSLPTLFRPSCARHCRELFRSCIDPSFLSFVRVCKSPGPRLSLWTGCARLVISSSFFLLLLEVMLSSILMWHGDVLVRNYHVPCAMRHWLPTDPALRSLRR